MFYALKLVHVAILFFVYVKFQFQNRIVVTSPWIMIAFELWQRKYTGNQKRKKKCFPTYLHPMNSVNVAWLSAWTEHFDVTNVAQMPPWRFGRTFEKFTKTRKYTSTNENRMENFHFDGNNFSFVSNFGGLGETEGKERRWLSFLCVCAQLSIYILMSAKMGHAANEQKSISLFSSDIWHDSSSHSAYVKLKTSEIICKFSHCLAFMTLPLKYRISIQLIRH